jgi:TDG/mug DNA glycosylase family protein
MTELIGYQERVGWMGTEIVTLAEIWPSRPRAVIVGINPSITSVATGHYFQGQGARSRIMMLVKAGLIELRDGERHFERAALEAEVGFADLVRRPTRAATDLTVEEIEYGKSHVESNMEARGISLVIGIYAPPVEALLGIKPRPGYQLERTAWGARVFNLPRPYLKSEIAAEVMSTLRVE